MIYSRIWCSDVPHLTSFAQILWISHSNLGTYLHNLDNIICLYKTQRTSSSSIVPYVSCISVCHVFQCAIYFSVPCISVCHVFQCVMYFRVSCISVCHVFQCAMYFRVPYISVCQAFQCAMYFNVPRISASSFELSTNWVHACFPSHS